MIAEGLAALPRVLFFCINGAGLGHMSRCLAYARPMQGRARPIFFCLASAVDLIHQAGFEADYFVSEYWSRSHINAWNRELAIRFGLMLEEVRPEAVVFDGTWPFHGFMDACDIYGVPRRVWSNRRLHKEGFPEVPVEETAFDLVIEPGEIGASFAVQRAAAPGRKVTTPPVTLLRADEVLEREDARRALGLESEGRYALFSLGAGNLNDVGETARSLISEVESRGFTVLWARVPISVSDPWLPDSVIAIDRYPLGKYMRAFDVFVGAAGYNTCCEVLQTGVPTLLVPNTRSADDQARRAGMVATHAPAVVSACETTEKRFEAITELCSLADRPARREALDLGGAQCAADEILGLLTMETPR